MFESPLALPGPEPGSPLESNLEFLITRPGMRIIYIGHTVLRRIYGLAVEDEQQAANL